MGKGCMYMYVAKVAEKKISYDCYVKKNVCLDAFFIHISTVITQ